MESVKKILSQIDFTKLATIVAPYVKKFINDDTAVGKAGKAAKWSIISLLLVVICTAIVANPATFTAAGWGVAVVIANIVLVLLKNIGDSNTPNF